MKTLGKGHVRREENQKVKMMDTDRFHWNQLVEFSKDMTLANREDGKKTKVSNGEQGHIVRINSENIEIILDVFQYGPSRRGEEHTVVILPKKRFETEKSPILLPKHSKQWGSIAECDDDADGCFCDCDD